MRVPIVSIGNSKGIRLPKAIIELCGFGPEVDLEVHGDTLVIRPTHKKPKPPHKKPPKPKKHEKGPHASQSEKHFRDQEFHIEAEEDFSFDDMDNENED